MLKMRERVVKKIKRSMLQECRAWFPKALLLWIFFMATIGSGVYHWIEGETMKTREEILVSKCNQRAEVLQKQFNLVVNYAHDLTIIISASHISKHSSAIGPETLAHYTARSFLMDGAPYAERVINSERIKSEKAHRWTVETISPVRDVYAPVIISQDTFSSIESMDMVSDEIVVKVLDVTNESEPLIIYRNVEQDGDASLSHPVVLDFGDPNRKHLIECRYRSNAPMSFEALKIAILVFLIGLFSVFIAYHVGMYVIVYVIKVEDESRKMQELEIRAKAANAAKSQFLVALFNISTYMNVFLRTLDVLVDTELNTTQRDYSRTAQDCGKDLLSLLNSVLDHEKIEAGKLELEQVMFDIRSMLDDVLSLFSEKSRSKGIEFAVFVSSEVPKTVIGDPDRFRQILTNLVGNSIKFTEYGHIFIRVCHAEYAKTSNSDSNLSFETLSGFQVADDRNSWKKFKRMLDNDENISNDEKITLLVSVEDTGTGIPLHAQRRVFTPFMQGDNSNSRSYGGIGIGLSVTKCLVELMNGEISFVTQPNIGSTFSFTAVFTKCENDEVTRPPMEGFTAIVVDPRPVRATVTKYHLNRLGIRVQIADSVESAFVIFGEVDLILVEKEAWLHSESSNIFPKKTRSTEFFLLAINLDGDEIERAKLAGFSHTVVIKPLSAKVMAAYLHAISAAGRNPHPVRGRSM